jgi:hypothetical protein
VAGTIARRLTSPNSQILPEMNAPPSSMARSSQACQRQVWPRLWWRPASQNVTLLPVRRAL